MAAADWRRVAQHRADEFRAQIRLFAVMKAEVGPSSRMTETRLQWLMAYPRKIVLQLTGESSIPLQSCCTRILTCRLRGNCYSKPAGENKMVLTSEPTDANKNTGTKSPKIHYQYPKIIGAL